ncbi:reprolysin-like metallopeptidase [Flavobacterium sp.]|uniref:reprolysin-like metallopeptidase n=1 Tax=Flavobacterium sp. TaxID=239 RepID=UPI0026200635|nr:zinc-dependent metalloprotease family protein [Flavobacterium sp.]MDD3003669.1 zinc-dependent metalloprotease family protein [Flavobacterium sp.]
MKKIILVLFAFFSFAISFAQSGWTKIEESEITMLEKVNRSSVPKTYQLFYLDLEVFKSQLTGAPVRGLFSGRSQQIIYLPNAEGNLERFYVMETPIMEEGLAQKFPMIKSYAAQGVDNPLSVARFSVTQFGLHNMTMTPQQSISYIDPLTEDRKYYIVYTKDSLPEPSHSFECATADKISSAIEESSTLSVNAADDSKLRTYRLALSCTGEYGALFAGTGTVAQRKANIQAQMAITMTRVNGIYERDFAITMIFVANNDLLLYYNATTDPWTGEYNTKTAQTIDAAIGLANYDIGHNFNTSGGGNAGCIGCVCSSTASASSSQHKGRGFTGSPNPTGDAFDIDYVAHEMGHQFGGFHTQSSSNCISGDGNTEVEPGSGSTIMGYAGICPPNIKSSSDAYFHYVTIRDITNNVKTGFSSGCAQITTFSNTAPTANAGKDYVIPSLTPFMLTGTGTDADGDILTYTWEQNDPESYNQANTSAPNQNKTTGPLFRSEEGTTNPTRFFPKKSTVIAGNTSTQWEVLPAVARVMNFALTVRDNVAGGAQTATDEMKVTVSSTGGAFSITSQNTVMTYAAATNQEVTWNVAMTNQAPVNTPFVDIYLSTDGGNTFPILLASKVPNDGSETITIPNIPGSSNRIMVKGHDNIFYDICNKSFVITAASNTFSIAFSGIEKEQNKSICKTESLTYTLPYTTYGTFNALTTFTAENLPTGVTATFSPATATTSTNVVMTLTSTSAAIPQFNTILVKATSGVVSKTTNVYVNILDNSFSSVNLISPAASAQTSSDLVNFSWSPSTGANAYEVQIALDADFNNIVEQVTVATNSYSSTTLTNLETYFWRILPKNESCSGSFSTSSSFSTLFCDFITSTNVPVTIPQTVSTTSSTITVNAADSVTINDLNVQLNITHSYISDVTARLTSPNGTQVILFSNKCGNKSNANAIFDDAGSTLVCETNPAITGVLIPEEALSAFNGQTSEGIWTLTISDNFSGDGGQINSWGLNFCSPAPPLDVVKNEFSDVMVYPNPNNGSFNVQFKNTSTDKVDVKIYDMSGRLIFDKNYINQVDFNENIQLNSVQSGVYLMSIFDGEKNLVKRIIID